MAGGDDAVAGYRDECCRIDGGDEVGASVLYVGGGECGVDSWVQGVLRAVVF